jgi:hypothetical protein
MTTIAELGAFLARENTAAGTAATPPAAAVTTTNGTPIAS